MEENHTLENFDTVKNKMISSTTNVIFYNDPFSKTRFLNKIMDSFEDQITYLDFDLLYSGYVQSGYIPKKSNTKIIKLDSKNLQDSLPNILSKISSEKTILILDSLNGLYNFSDDENPARFVNSLVMLMTANAKFSKSILFVTCLGQKKDEVWTMPSGRHILEFENINRFEITENDMKIGIHAI